MTLRLHCSTPRFYCYTQSIKIARLLVVLHAAGCNSEQARTIDGPKTANSSMPDAAQVQDSLCIKNEDCAPLTCIAGACSELSTESNACDDGDSADCIGNLDCEAKKCISNTTLKRIVASGPLAMGGGNGIVGWTTLSSSLQCQQPISSAPSNNRSLFELTEWNAVLDPPVKEISTLVVNSSENSAMLTRYFDFYGDDNRVLGSFELQAETSGAIVYNCESTDNEYALFHFDGSSISLELIKP